MGDSLSTLRELVVVHELITPGFSSQSLFRRSLKSAESPCTLCAHRPGPWTPNIPIERLQPPPGSACYPSVGKDKGLDQGRLAIVKLNITSAASPQMRLDRANRPSPSGCSASPFAHARDYVKGLNQTLR